MDIENELTANIILNEIHEIIYDDALSDVEAVEAIVIILEKYNVYKNNRFI